MSPLPFFFSYGLENSGCINFVPLHETEISILFSQSTFIECPASTCCGRLCAGIGENGDAENRDRCSQVPQYSEADIQAKKYTVINNQMLKRLSLKLFYITYRIFSEIALYEIKYVIIWQ